MQRSGSAVSPSGPAADGSKAGTHDGCSSSVDMGIRHSRRSGPVQRSRWTDWRPQDRAPLEGEGARIHIRTGEHPSDVVLALCLFGAAVRC